MWRLDLTWIEVLFEIVAIYINFYNDNTERRVSDRHSIKILQPTVSQSSQAPYRKDNSKLPDKLFKIGSHLV